MARRIYEQQGRPLRPPWAPSRSPSPDGRLRVGLLCPVLNAGGAEAMQLALARYADPARVSWMGCCVAGESLPIDPGMLAATSALMPVSVGFGAAFDLAGRCDVLVVWAIDGLDRLVAGIADPPRVVSVIHAPADSPWGQSVYARTAGIDRWVAVSELALDGLPDSSRTIPSSVIWNAVDRERLAVRRDRAAMRQRWGVPDDAPVAGYLGRLSAEKDPLAMRRLADALPEPWRVVVVGEGAERANLKAHPRMILAGSDAAAGDVLNAFDVLVVPSEYESFGLTLAEGLALRRPVVSTEVGIAKIVPGLTEPIPINADGPTLAAAVLRAWRDGPRPEAASILPRLDPERFGREWTELLCSMVLAKPGANPPGLLRKAASLARAVATQALAGNPHASPEVAESRRAACFACEHHDHAADKCNLCGCTGMVWKRSMATQGCPDAPPRWEAVTGA